MSVDVQDNAKGSSSVWIETWHTHYTLCPNKSDPLADFLITCNNVYRIEHNFMNTYPYVLQRIMQSFWKIRLSVTEKSNGKQNHINVRLYNCNLFSVLQ